MEDTPVFVYTLSSRGILVKHAIRSIRTLLKQAPNAKIVVFYTPPHDDEDLHSLKNLDIEIRQVDHAANPFVHKRGNTPGYYGDKLHLCSIRSGTVIFLDCDTIILDDPHQLVKGESDLRIRREQADIDHGELREAISDYSANGLDWMPNCGVMVFQNNLHRRIEESWRQAYEWVLEKKPRVNDDFPAEQIALAAAINDSISVNKLEQHEHVLEWADPPVSDGVIHHLETGMGPNYLPPVVDNKLSYVFKKWYQIRE